MMSHQNSSRAEEIVQELISRQDQEGDDARDLTLEELSEVYRSLWRQRGSDPLLRVVSLQDRLMAQFPEVSNQLLYVELQKTEKPRDSLSFVLRLDWFGPTERSLTWRGFFLGEIRAAWWLLLPIGAVLLAGLIALHDVELMSSINRLALTSLSIFISIFIVFVIGESKWLTNRMDLFRSGRLHQFMDADRMMIRVALLALLLGFANAGLLLSDERLDLIAGKLDLSHAWGPLLTTVVLLLLLDLFIAIPRYYVRRLRVMIERDAVREILVRPGEKVVGSVRAEDRDD